MKNFEINKHGVVLNPNTPYYYKMPNGSMLDYVELRTGLCKNGLWDFGYSLPNCSSPCCIGRYASEQEAINAAIKTVLDSLAQPSELVSAAFLHKAKASFTQFAASFYITNPQYDNILDAGTQLALF